jgi:hypothetical protein
MTTDEDICTVCGILKGEDLIPEPYEAMWDAGEAIYCPDCGRQLTFGEGEA